MTTITSFNVDVSAIDNNAATTSHLLCESPTAASMLINANLEKKTKHYYTHEEANEYEGVQNINLTHNMQEQAELYQDVIQFDKSRGTYDTEGTNIQV